jgi:hypothetical protein
MWDHVVKEYEDFHEDQIKKLDEKQMSPCKFFPDLKRPKMKAPVKNDEKPKFHTYFGLQRTMSH